MFSVSSAVLNRMVRMVTRTPALKELIFLAPGSLSRLSGHRITFVNARVLGAQNGV